MYVKKEAEDLMAAVELKEVLEEQVDNEVSVPQEIKIEEQNSSNAIIFSANSNSGISGSQDGTPMTLGDGSPDSPLV